MTLDPLSEAQAALAELRATSLYRSLHPVDLSSHIGKCEAHLLAVIAALQPAPPPAGAIIFDGLWDKTQPTVAKPDPYTLVNVTFAGGTFTAKHDPTLNREVCEVFLPTAAANPSPAAITAKNWRTIPLGTVEWYGCGFRFPSGWNPTNQYALEMNYPKLKYGPVIINCQHDRIAMEFHTGHINWHGLPPNASNPATFDFYMGPTDPRGFIVPPELYAPNVWHLLMFRNHWATDGTGSVVGYHLKPAVGLWSKTVALQNIPTVQWGYGISPPDFMGPDGKDQNGKLKQTSDLVGGYGEGPADQRYDMLGLVIGTTPEVVAARLGFPW